MLARCAVLAVAFVTPPLSELAPSERITLASTTLMETDFGAIAGLAKASGRQIPAQVTSASLLPVADADSAELLMTVGKQVYRHYIFANRPARFKPPDALAPVFSTAVPGLCEGASAMVRKLLDGKLNAENLNFISPMPKPQDPSIEGDAFELVGHTVAQIRLPRGAVAIDPTYGFLLVTPSPSFDASVFASKNYSIYALFDQPDEADPFYSPYRGLEFYDRAGDPNADVKISGDRIDVKLPVIRIPARGLVEIGDRDGSDDDIREAFGGWANHIGFWYEPTRHSWRFAPSTSGRYEITFYLMGGDQNAAYVLQQKLNLSIRARHAQIIESQITPDDNSSDLKGEIRLIVQATGEFDVELSSQGVGARLLDSITIHLAALEQSDL